MCHDQINTVEKFQSGERDMRTSNQGHGNALADFLLDLQSVQRRYQPSGQKVVIVASEALFRVGPTDTGENAEQKSWKLLYDELGCGGTSATTATLDGADISTLVSRLVDLSVYTGVDSREN